MSTPAIHTPRERPFGIGTRIDGFEVIANDTGRPVGARIYETAQQANGAAYRLNMAAADGPKALRRALGAGDRA